MRLLEGHLADILDLAYSPDGRTLATGSADGTLRLWNLASGACQRGAAPSQGATVTDVAFVQGGQSVAGVRVDPWQGRRVVLWNAVGGRERKPLPIHKTSSAIHGRPLSPELASGLAAQPHGDLLAAGGGLGVKVWDARRCQLRVPFYGHTCRVGCVAFSADGRWLASGGADGAVHLWDVAAGGVLRTTWQHQHTVDAVRFAPDGRTIAALCDGVVRFWDVAARRVCGGFTEPDTAVRCLAFSPDGRAILTGEEAGTVSLRDATTGMVHLAFDWGLGPVRKVAVSADGMTAAACAGRTAVVWDLDL